MYHQPVLLTESIESLNIRPDGIYVDVTYGGGGHSQEILKRLGKSGKLLGFDRDEDALANKIDDDRVILINHNYRFLKNFLTYYNALPVDGILADLGVSSHQFDVAGRGFSIRLSGELDMRMNRRQNLTAAHVLNEYEEERLAKVFRDYGELTNGHSIAARIVKARSEKSIATFDDLRTVLSRFAHPGRENKFWARVFQALRIEINNELDALKEMLEQALQVLKPSGRLVVISYHSLEDRLVKHFMKTGNFEGIAQKDFFGNVHSPFKMITKKPVVPGSEEISTNSRSRSARLRVAEKQ